MKEKDVSRVNIVLIVIVIVKLIVIGVKYKRLRQEGKRITKIKETRRKSKSRKMGRLTL